jgi:hypothetical protein
MVADIAVILEHFSCEPNIIFRVTLNIQYIKKSLKEVAGLFYVVCRCFEMYAIPIKSVSSI